MGVVGFLALHVVLAMVVKAVPLVGTIHQLGVLGLGLLWLAKDDRPDRVVYLTAYIVGAELLWRGTHTAIVWEFGKYSVGLLMMLSILKFRRLLPADKKPLLYLALLLPSVFWLPDFDREAISYYLSGPFALAAAVMFFSSTSLTPRLRNHVLLALLAPIVAAAFLTLTSTISAENIAFSGESNFVTSAGYGPNQTSSILGLGAMVAFLYALGERDRRFLRGLMVFCALWLAAQSALTFSRGGMVTTLLALVVAIMYLLRDRRSRVGVMFAGAVSLLIAIYVVFPILNDYTEGALAERFSDMEPTGRFEIAQGDLAAFADYPVTGVGPGRSRPYHALFFRESTSHTEYTRMLSEHGLPGLFALLVLLAMAAQRLRVSAPKMEKAFVLSLTTWAMLFMAHSAMRLVAPSFVFGLTAATFLTGDEVGNSGKDV